MDAKTQIETLFLVGTGGFLGANARYLLSDWAGQKFSMAFGLSLPYGILFVNVIGSLGLALFLTWTGNRIVVSPQTRLLIATGFFGAFTTFSTYAAQSVFLIRDGDLTAGIANIVLNNGICIVAVLIGVILGNRL